MRGVSDIPMWSELGMIKEVFFRLATYFTDDIPGKGREYVIKAHNSRFSF